MPEGHGSNFENSKRFQAVPFNHPEKKRRINNKVKAVAAVGILAGTAAVAGMLENSEGTKPNPTEVYDGTVRITRQIEDTTGKTKEARIREEPDIPHGSSAKPNTYPWTWESNEIFITHPKIVESYNPADGNQRSGIWIQFPVDGDQKYIAWSPANTGIVEALPGGKFIKGEFNPDGSFDGEGDHDFKSEDLSVVSIEPPADSPQK